MGLKDEIFEEFFNELDKKRRFPQSYYKINDLKIKYDSSDIDNKNKILGINRIGRF